MTTTAAPPDATAGGYLQPDSDEALGMRLVAGDTDALAALFERYGQAIHDYVARRVSDPTLAEDLVQQTFLRAMERSSNLRAPKHVRSWLYKIAHFLILNDARDRPALASVDAMVAVASPAAGPEIELIGRSAVDLVWSAAASLDERQLNVLQLSLRHQLSAAEVGEVIGVSPRHASVLVHRAGEALGTAVRSLVLAKSRNHCPGLAELIPAGVTSLTAEQHHSVDHHLRRCTLCRAAADRLTSPAELFGAIALLPIPAKLAAHAWLPNAGASVSQTAATAAHVAGWPTRAGARARSLVTTPAALAGMAAIAILGGAGGAYSLLHRSEPAGPAAPVAAPPAIVAASAPPTPADEAAKTAGDVWADTLGDVRRSSSYHLVYTKSPGQPSTGDLDMRFIRSGDFAGRLTLNGLSLDTYDIVGVGGRVFVSSASVVQTPYLFGLSDTQAASLGTAWLELTDTGSQHSFLIIVQQTVTPFATPDQLAAGILSQSGTPRTDGVTTVNGQRLIHLADDTGTMDVTDTGEPYPVRVSAVLGDLLLDGFNIQAAVAPPASSRTLPGM